MWIGISSVFPDLICLRSQVDFGVGVTIENASLFVIEVEDGLLIHSIFLEEGLIGSHNFRVLSQACAHALSESNELLDAFRREKRVTIDIIGSLPYTIDASSPLDQANNGPGQIIIDDNGGI